MNLYHIAAGLLVRTASIVVQEKYFFLFYSIWVVFEFKHVKTYIIDQKLSICSQLWLKNRKTIFTKMRPIHFT